MDNHGRPRVETMEGAVLAGGFHADTPAYEYFWRTYRSAFYYSSGRNWSDYAPAYRHGYENFDRHYGRRFEEVEARLACDWDRARDGSRLVWAEARWAVREAWRDAERRARRGMRHQRY